MTRALAACLAAGLLILAAVAVLGWQADCLIANPRAVIPAAFAAAWLALLAAALILSQVKVPGRPDSAAPARKAHIR